MTTGRTTARRISQVLEECDSFPKVEEVYLKQTKSGAVATIFCYIVMLVLMTGELISYIFPRYEQHFVVDNNISHTINLSLDISLASPCSKLNVFTNSESEHKETVDHHLEMREEDFMALAMAKDQEFAHSVQNFLREPSIDVVAKLTTSDQPFVEGCRLRGTIPISKTNGALTISPIYDRLGFFGQLFMAGDTSINFSHYIHKLSVGADFPGSVNPLEASRELTLQNHQRFVYFLSILPTDYRDHLRDHSVKTHQYSVSGLLGKPNGQSASLSFNYTLEPLQVIILRSRQPFLEFFVHMVGILGGIYTCSGLIHHATQWVLETVGIVNNSSDKRNKSRSLDNLWSPIMTNDALLKSTTHLKIDLA